MKLLKLRQSSGVSDPRLVHYLEVDLLWDEANTIISEGLFPTSEELEAMEKIGLCHRIRFCFNMLFCVTKKTRIESRKILVLVAEEPWRTTSTTVVMLLEKY